MSKEDERVLLEPEAAIALLDVRDGQVHSFRQAGFALIGCDWSLEHVRELFSRHKPELAGESASKMRHGVVAVDEHGAIFFATAAEVPS